MSWNLSKIDIILDTWTIPSLQWNKYVKVEKRNKKEDNTYFGIGILVLGIPTLMLLRGTSFIVAFIFSIPFALLIPWLRQQFSYTYLKNNYRESIIEIYSNFLLINGKKIDFYGKNKWIKNVKIIETNEDFKLLEFTIEWETRNGNTNDETRIPIPKNKLQKAEELIDFFGFKN